MKRPDPGPHDDPDPSPEMRFAAERWERTVERYSRLVYSIPLRFGLSFEDAEDVFQSTMLTAMRLERTPPADDRIVRWLASVASWETRNLIRRRAREARFLGPLGERREAPRPAIEEAEDVAALAAALAALRPRERRLLGALFLEAEPLTYREVAKRIGVAVGSVGELRRRAIDHLRRELLRRGYEGPEGPGVEPPHAHGRAAG